MKRVLIVGLGLIGGSYAKALAQSGLYRIDAFDQDAAVLKLAQCDGVIERGIKEHDAIEDVYDIVLLSLYPEGITTFMLQYSQRFASAIVCDVAGLQGVIIQKLSLLLNNKQIAYVSLHPMAGRERFGYEMAQRTLFRNKSCLYTNVTASEHELAQIKKLHQQIGFACMKEVQAEEHDRLIAFTSQLPHVIATAFMNTWENCQIEGFTGGSFEDLTRVADINADLWQSLFLENKEALLVEIELFQKQMSWFEEALRKQDGERLHQLMRHSSAAKNEVRNQLLKEGTIDA